MVNLERKCQSDGLLIKNPAKRPQRETVLGTHNDICVEQLGWRWINRRLGLQPADGDVFARTGPTNSDDSYLRAPRPRACLRRNAEVQSTSLTGRSSPTIVRAKHRLTKNPIGIEPDRRHFRRNSGVGSMSHMRRSI